MTTVLKGLTWDDLRGYGPMEEVGRSFELHGGDRSVLIKWDVGSLAGFESAPIHDLADQYDLLVMDHPHTVEAVVCNCLAPIGELEDAYVGKCRESYRWNGQQWAVPIDAACHVAAYRTDRLAAPPEDWSTVFELARNGRRVAAPLAGVHSLMALLTILACLGSPVCDAQSRLPGNDDIHQSLALLRRLAQVGSKDALDWNPIESLQALVEDRCDYLALTFGYAHFQGSGVRFAAVPRVDPSRASRGVLGGAGLAVSARSAHRDCAIAFARFAGSEIVQAGVWPKSGGQPAHRAAWEALSRHDPFYRDGRTAMESSFVRPRAARWNELQTRAGEAINHWLRGRQEHSGRLVAKLRALWSAADLAS